MAKRFLAALVLLALGTSGLDVKVDYAKNRPVTKVINLLKDMLKQLEKEAEEDEDLYDKMGCWCVTYEKEKKKSIAGGESRIVELKASIEELAGEYARFNAEVENLQKELAKNSEALDSATALRTKQLAEFDADEKDTIVSIGSLKAAVTTLSKHNSALLQTRQTDIVNLAASVERALRKYQDKFPGLLLPRQQKIVASFAQQPGDYFDAEPTLAQAKGPSSEIFGILQGMKENFESNLAKAQKEEVTNVGAYNDLKAAKQAQIAAATSQIEAKSGAAADANEKRGKDKEDLEDTENTVAADQKFLADLTEKCASADKEFVERTSTRQQEIQATSKALEFLSSDEAHDLFTRTFNPTLLQVGGKAISERRAKAAALIDEAAKKSKDPRLSVVTSQVRLDAFTEVKKTIQDMIDKLMKEKDDDVKHKDYCIDEFNANEVDTANKERELEQQKAKIESLTRTIDELDQAIETLKADIQELQLNQKQASLQRQRANKEYIQTVSDQKATQKLITAALTVLKQFYEKAALVQASSAGTASLKQPPPPGFKTYEKSAASGGVMGVMQNIIDEAKGLEEEAVRGEEEAQASFEEFTRDTTQSINDKTKDSVNKAEEKSETEKERVQMEAYRDTSLTELEELAQVNKDLHNSCDFLMKNFGPRGEARDGEIEALKQGLALFSGASFSAFLQRP